jgi:hypothetical protein
VITEVGNMKIRSLAVARSVAVIGGMGALIAGVTFAALTSGPATLASNTLSTATAELQVSNNGTTFSPSVAGFAVTGLIPGDGSTHKKFYMKNSGDVDLALSVHVPHTPPAPTGGYGFTGWQNLKVFIKDLSTGEVTTTNMTDLLAGDVSLTGSLGQGVTGNPATPAAPGNYELWYDITPSALTGGTAGVGAFDLQFMGTSTTASPTPTVTPAPTATPVPTATPSPEVTPTPSPTPSV